MWPFAFAFGAAVLAVGLVTYQAVFVIGIVLLLVSGAEWTAEAWAQRASADAGHNAEVRDRIANPLEFPLAAAIGIGVVVYAFSRVMLFLSKTNTVIAFAVLGSIIIALAFFFAYRPRVPSKAAAVVIGVGAFGLIAGGAAAGLSGERDIHPHETTSGLTEEGADICTSPEEFEADENASQSVAATRCGRCHDHAGLRRSVDLLAQRAECNGSRRYHAAAVEPEQRPVPEPVGRGQETVGQPRNRRRGGHGRTKCPC